MVFGRQRGNTRAGDLPIVAVQTYEHEKICRYDEQILEKCGKLPFKGQVLNGKLGVAMVERKWMAKSQWAEEGLQRLNLEVERLE